MNKPTKNKQGRLKNDFKKPLKSSRKKRKSSVYELIYGLICLLTTAVFCILPIILLSNSNAITINIKHGYAFLIFIGVCAVSAGFFLFYRQYVNRMTQSKILRDACNKILRGEYELDIEDLSGEYQKIANALILVCQRLKLADKEKNDFINDFSHELKTPIVSIRGFARLISKGNLTEEEENEYLAIIVSESERLIDLTASTLMLDRLGNSNLEISKEYYNLSEQIRKCVLLLQNDWEKRNIEIVADFDDHNVFSNAELTSQLFLNVIQNAIKFSNDGSKVEIAISKTDKQVLVEIKDYGIGMDEETQKRMFDKYFRGDKSRSTHGNGLGLSTVKKISEILGLDLKVTSSLTVGTTFSISFKNK